MARTLSEIADDLDAAQDALDRAGRAIGGPDGRGELYKPGGEPIDFRGMARDLREHDQA